MPSHPDPFPITTLPPLPGGGHIAIAPAPGKPPSTLHTDLDAIAAWNATAVITLIEQHELDALGLAAFPAELHRRHIPWRHWPIPDYSVPGSTFMSAWPHRAATLARQLAAGARILIHCHAGRGRSGMLAARILVQTGTPPADAITTVRAARPGAIETTAQAAWVAGSG